VPAGQHVSLAAGQGWRRTAPDLRAVKLQHVVLALARNIANLPSQYPQKVLCNLAPVLAVAPLLDMPDIKNERSNSADAWADDLLTAPAPAPVPAAR
jgi:hypothetical protein